LYQIPQPPSRRDLQRVLVVVLVVLVEIVVPVAAVRVGVADRDHVVAGPAQRGTGGVRERRPPVHGTVYNGGMRSTWPG